MPPPPPSNYNPAIMVQFTTKSHTFWLPIQLDISERASISGTQNTLAAALAPCLDSQTNKSIHASSLAITFVWKGYAASASEEGGDGDDVETIIDARTPFGMFRACMVFMKDRGFVDYLRVSCKGV